MRTGIGLTAAGWTTMVAGLAWCGVAGFLGQRDLWWPGLFLALLPLGSRLLLLSGSTRFSVKRRLAHPRVAVGQTSQVHLEVDPGGIIIGGHVQLRDQLAPALGDAGWQSLPTGLGRWRQTVSYELRPRVRGRHRVGPAERTVTDGLGLAKAKQVLGGVSELLATPQVEPLANLRAASGLGVAIDTSLLRTGLGSSDDVLIREYRHGDDVRRIHWRSTARTGEMMVRREERAWDPSATVIIDNRGAGYSRRTPDSRLEWAVSAAASIAVHLLVTGFDLSLTDAGGRVITPHRVGPGREEVVLEYLTDLAPVATRSLADAIAAAGRAAEGQLLVSILGRVDSADAAALATATRHGRACWALLVATGNPAVDAAAATAIRQAGWRCVLAGPGTPVPTAWTGFGREDSR